MPSKILFRLTCVSLAIAILVLTGRDARAQLAPTGGHYAGRASDTGFTGGVTSSGGYSTTIPLDLPPSRGGLPIPLQIVYGGNVVGAAGAGWDIPLSYVRVDTTFQRRRPAFYQDINPSARTQKTVSLNGATSALVPRVEGGQTYWYPQNGTLQLRLTPVGTSQWKAYDGNGVTYTFTLSGLLSGTGVFLLTRIDGPTGAYVVLNYAIATLALPGGGAGVSIDLSNIQYNPSPTVTNCIKDTIQLNVTPDAATPYATTMIGTVTIARAHTLKSIYVRVRPDCTNSSVLLRAYYFSYQNDADTGMPRLNSVTVSARGDSTDHTLLPVVNYSYGSATIPDSTDPQGIRRLLQYNKSPQTIPVPSGANPGFISETIWNQGTLPTDIHETAFSTDQSLLDVDGDGRPDLVFTQNRQLYYARNISGGAAQVAFAPGPAQPLNDTTFMSGPIELSSGTNPNRQSTTIDEPDPGYYTESLWRMAIDVNGDGRIDFIDGADPQHPDAWVVYVNSPGAGPTPKWIAHVIPTGDVRTALQAMPDLPAHYVPLSRRKSGKDKQWRTICGNWNDVTNQWTTYPDWLNWPLCHDQPCQDSIDYVHYVDAPEFATSLDPLICNHSTNLEITAIEWELRDVNGDGYPDLVYNSSPIQSQSNGFFNKGQNTTRYYEEHDLTPSTGPIYGLLNVAGPRLDDGSPIFSKPVALANDGCGVGLWVSANSAGMTEGEQTMNCAFADVNGDGLVDRVVRGSVYLGRGVYPLPSTGNYDTLSIVSMTLPPLDANNPGVPGPFARQSNLARQCPQQNQNTTTEPAHLETALRDINGDGIPDYVDINPLTGVGSRAWIGTGTGFNGPIPLTGDGQNGTAWLTLSDETVRCDGLVSQSTSGAYDINGDGKPERVWIDQYGFHVSQLIGPSGVVEAPDAGRLTTIDNGYKSLTRVTYGSAKAVQPVNDVPFPEIVVTMIETVSTDPNQPQAYLATTHYAYNQPQFFFDPVMDRFRFAGYGRTVKLVEADPTNAVGSVATITDTFPFYDGNVLPSDPRHRFGRFLRVGQPSVITTLAGTNVGNDASALLSASTGDSRRIAQTQYTFETRFFQEDQIPAPNCTTQPVTFSEQQSDCTEFVDPYDFRTSACQSAFDACTSHGFIHLASVKTARGTDLTGGEQVQTQLDVKTGCALSVDTTDTYCVDDYGHLLNVIDYHDANRADDTVCVDTTFTNPTNFVPRTVNAVAGRRVYDCQSGTLANDSYSYDTNTGRMTSHAVDRYRTDTSALLGTIQLFTATYDTNGNPTAITQTRSQDGATRTTTFDYDPFALAVVHSRVTGTGVAPQDVYTTLDSVSLDVLSVKDPNNTQRGTTYDGFGRPSSTTITPDGGTPGVLASFTYNGFSPGSTGRSIQAKVFADPVPAANVATAPGRVATTYLDPLGRPTYTQVQLGTDYQGDSLVVGSRTYDTYGRVYFEADPFPQGQTSQPYGTSYYFGPDGFPTVSVRGSGPQPYTETSIPGSELFPTRFMHGYANYQEVVRVKDAASLTPGSPQEGVIKEEIRTALGRPLNRTTYDKLSAKAEYAELTHDRLGHLTSFVRYQDPNGGTPVATSMVNDSLGRVLQLQEPLNPLQVRTFDDFGELTSVNWMVTSSDPFNGIVNQYDALGRLVHSEEQNANITDPSTVKDYTYDTAFATPQVTPTYVLGRLARASATTGDVVFSYDAFGNANAKNFRDSSGTAYVEKHTFHGDGTPVSLELDLPDNGYAAERVNYAFDSAGRLRSMVYSNGTNSQTIYTGTTLDDLGRLRSAAFGADTYAAVYADMGRQLLQNFNVTSAQSTRKITFGGYDSLGRETTRTESTGALALDKSTGSTYDLLGRLSSSVTTTSSATIGNRSFTFDPLGNVNKLVDNVGSLGVVTSRLTTDPDRLCAILYQNSIGIEPPPCNVTYDKFGNITSSRTRGGTTRTLAYYNSGGVKTITDSGGATASFRYGAMGELQELDVTGTTLDARHDRNYGAYIAKHDQTSGGTTTSVISRQFPGPNVVAIRRGPSGPWVFQFGEARGTRFTTDQNGAFLQDVSYQPFGEANSPPPGNPQPGSAQYSSEQWNGGDALAAFGLVHLGARLYDPAIGQFLSRDPLFIPRTAATTNPYAFANNDPVNNSDPTGLDCEGLSDCLGGFVAGVVGLAGAGVDALINGGGRSGGNGTGHVGTPADYYALGRTLQGWTDARTNAGYYNFDDLRNGWSPLAHGFWPDIPINEPITGAISDVIGGGYKAVAGGVQAGRSFVPMVRGEPGAARTYWEGATSGFGGEMRFFRGGAILLPVAGLFGRALSTALSFDMGFDEAVASATESFAAEMNPVITEENAHARLVADLVNTIEHRWPGHVVGLDVPVLDAEGLRATEIDILLRNAAIQVKSRFGEGAVRQLWLTEAGTDLPVILYGPYLRPGLVRMLGWEGSLVTTDLDVLMAVIAP